MAIAAVSGQNSGSAAEESPHVEAFTADVTSGSLIIVCGFQREFANQGVFVTSDCTKSAGVATIDTIQLDSERNQDFGGGNHTRSGIWSCLVTGSGSLTMSVESGGMNDTHTHVHEFTGTWDSSRLEDSSDNGTGSANNNASTGNGTSVGIALFVGAAHTLDPDPVGMAEDAAFTLIVETFETTTGNSEASSIYRISTGALTDEGFWTLGNNTGFSAALAVYKEAAAGGATPKGPFGLPLHGPFGGPIG